MSDERDPETDQKLPIPNDRVSCQDMVIADIEARKELGLRKYGTLLQPFNGRSFLQDAYEEVLDLAVYLRGQLEEEKEKTEEITHQISLSGSSVTMCCGTLIFELPRTDRIAVDAQLVNCKGHVVVGDPCV